MKLSVEGFYRFEKLKLDADGAEVLGSRQFLLEIPTKNLITNIGLDRMCGADGYLSWCRVGSGSATPAFTDVALQSQVASSDSLTAGANAWNTVEAYWSRGVVYRFAAGVATGNLSEVGVGWASTGSTLFSRARILDSAGDPTSITVLPDETLDVTYELRIYPSVADYTTTLNMKGVDYSVTLRPSMISTAVTLNSNAGWYLTTSGISLVQVSAAVTNALTGPMGAITSQPATGLMSGANSVAPAAYTPGNYYRDYTATIPLASSIGNIRSFRIRLGFGFYQMEFSPAIPKTASEVVTLTFRSTLARA